MDDNIAANFRFQIASDPDYESVYNEIYINDEFVCIVTKEPHSSHFVIEFPTEKIVNEKRCMNKISLESFQKILEDACEHLSSES